MALSALLAMIMAEAIQVSFSNGARASWGPTDLNVSANYSVWVRKGYFLGTVQIPNSASPRTRDTPLGEAEGPDPRPSMVGSQELCQEAKQCIASHQGQEHWTLVAAPARI